MGVNSYAEIFTTLIGWHMYNVMLGGAGLRPASSSCRSWEWW